MSLNCKTKEFDTGDYLYYLFCMRKLEIRKGFKEISLSYSKNFVEMLEFPVSLFLKVLTVLNI